MKTYILLLYLTASTAQAGWMAIGSLGLSKYSFRPLDTEITQNYNAARPKLTLGYSAKKIYDVGLYTWASPGNRQNPIPGVFTVLLLSYGANFGIRIKEIFYVGVEVGQVIYNMITTTNEDEEVVTNHQGLNGGLMLGPTFALDKHSVLHMNFFYSLSALQTPSSRLIDQVGLEVGYAYIMRGGSRGRSSLLGL